jgi:hypothetical protein
MTELQIANVLQLVVVTALSLFVLFRALPTYRVDSFRQKMFCVRDELFDFAVQGNVSFNDPAYVLLRQQMNALIRYGHQLTVFRMLMTNVINTVSQKGPKTTWSAVWEPSLEKINDEEVRVQLKRYHERAVMIAVKHLIWGSPVLWILMLLTAITLTLQGAATGLRQILKAAAKMVLVGPLDKRHIEEEAFAAAA